MSASSIINQLQSEIFTASELADIVKAVKAARNRSNSNAVRQLTIGTNVKFQKSATSVLTGSITSILKKNVVVDCGQYGKWSVAASALEIA